MAKGLGRQDRLSFILLFLYQFLSPFITVHHRLEKAKDDSELLEQFAPKHPSWSLAGDKR